MRTTLTHGLAVLSLITGDLTSGVAAAHAHQHGSVIGRILHKRAASSSSSSKVNGTDASNGKVSDVVLPTRFRLLTKQAALPEVEPPSGVQCLNEACDLLTIIADVVSSSQTKATVSEVHIRTVKVEQSESTAKPTRRRTVTRTTEVTVHEASSTATIYEPASTGMY